MKRSTQMALSMASIIGSVLVNTLNGNTYTESIDFGLGMDTYFGQKHTFPIRVEGDPFFLSGSLADGLKIEEVWQRVK